MRAHRGLPAWARRAAVSLAPKRGRADVMLWLSVFVAATASRGPWGVTFGIVAGLFGTSAAMDYRDAWWRDRMRSARQAADERERLAFHAGVAAAQAAERGIRDARRRTILATFPDLLAGFREDP